MADQKQIAFTIDGRPVTTTAGTLVIEAAKTQGIEVPSFCYYPGLSLQAACRMCLVEVEKMPKLQTACTLVATDGMVVKTSTEQVHKARKDMIEFLLSNHPLDCPVCDKGGECELQDMTFRYGLDKTRFVEEKLHTPEQKWSPLVYYDAPRCILCFRCVRVCDEGMDVKALGVGVARRAVRDPAQQTGRAGLRRVRHVHRHLPRRRAHQRHLSLPDAPVGNDLRRKSLRALLQRLQDHAQRAQQRNPARQ